MSIISPSAGKLFCLLSTHVSSSSSSSLLNSSFGLPNSFNISISFNKVSLSFCKSNNFSFSADLCFFFRPISFSVLPFFPIFLLFFFISVNSEFFSAFLYFSVESFLLLFSNLFSEIASIMLAFPTTVCFSFELVITTDATHDFSFGEVISSESVELSEFSSSLLSLLDDCKLCAILSLCLSFFFDVAPVLLPRFFPSLFLSFSSFTYFSFLLFLLPVLSNSLSPWLPLLSL